MQQVRDFSDTFFVNQAYFTTGQPKTQNSATVMTGKLNEYLCFLFLRFTAPYKSVFN